MKSNVSNKVSDDATKARVNRLLANDLRLDDLTRLFLYARDRCDGRESVQEIGDFVAHHAERTKGIITRETRDWYITARVMVSAIQKPLNTASLPSYFREFLAASLRRLGPEIVKQGMTSNKARHLLPSLIERFDENIDGTLSISSVPKDELKLFKILCEHITARPAFTAERLFDDFVQTLKSNALLAKNNLSDFEKIRQAVLLFAVSVMHRCEITLPDNEICVLQAGSHGADGKIQVDASIPTIDNPSIKISSAIFSTGLAAKDFCERALLVSPQPWNFAVEVTPMQRLAKLE